MVKILCVDDVPDNLKLLQADLEDEGYDVATACDGSDALAQLEKTNFSAVILDWMMPGLSGIETLKRIRQTYSPANLPVIMATALNEAENIVEALGAGANDYVTKPIESEILSARLGAHLRVRELTEALHVAATTDFLTGLPNRRHFFELVRPLFAAMQREQTKLAVAMMDIDHFKSVNDQHGHDSGDQVLRSVAAAIRESLRATDVIGRLGGEEFAVALYGADDKIAADVFERIRKTVAAENVTVGHNTLHVTISIGVTTEPEDCFDAMITRADTALYRAKELGRNRVECHQC